METNENVGVFMDKLMEYRKIPGFKIKKKNNL